MNEFEIKQQRIQALLDKHNLDALLLQRVSSFAWATCGAAGYVGTATTFGASSLLVTRAARYVITNNIEATRLTQEERLDAQGWELRATPWHAANAMAELTRGMKLGADWGFPKALDLTADLARVRANLLPEEGERFRALGKACADALDAAIRAVKPGMTEFEIAAQLALQAQRRGVQAIVNLIATDERIFKFRHPLPTAKKLERYAMLVLGGRQHGLVCSITRFVHFGKLPDEVQRKMEATARVDAAFIAATRPGKTLGEIFQRAQRVYAEAGFADEWQLHHQGGVAGYEGREYLGSPTATDVVALGQAFAWNPSITGAKSEDTILVGANGNEVLTRTDSLPTMDVNVDGITFARPAILIV
ncbi:MAG: aminopeptidase P family protein [Chloroflexi bacterium]|nr:aminopeptidase P family protein [Chloroflexota bacterium]